MKLASNSLRLLFIISMFCLTAGFLANRLSAITPDDYTKYDITREGLRRMIDSLGLSDIDEDQLQEALDDIMTGSNMADIYHHGDASWYFNDEAILEGQSKMQCLHARLLNELGTDTRNMTMPHNLATYDLTTARETIGAYLHLLQSFYSNTNWVESHADTICLPLGKPDGEPLPTAPTNMITCQPCRPGGLCKDNIVTDQLLTSGYKQDIQTNTLSKEATHLRGKCRHGGSSDTPSDNVGGINKESRDPTFSPHYYLHGQAADLAIRHTARLFQDLRSVLVQRGAISVFQSLFGLQQPQSVTIVTHLTDTNSSMVDDIKDQLQVANITVAMVTDLRQILKDQRCINSATKVLLITDKHTKDFPSLDLLRGRCHTMAPPTSTRALNIVLLEGDHTSGRRKRAATAGMDLYHLIADTSGGSVYITGKSSIGAVIDIIKDTVKSIPPVTVLKFKRTNTSSNVIPIPVDDLIMNMTIKIQGTNTPTMTLKRPDGSTEDFTHNTKQTLGMRLVVIKLMSPATGEWTLTRTDSHEWDIDVTATSSLDFTFKLMQPGPGGYGQYPLTGRPIAGANTTIQISVPQYDKVKSIESVLLLNRTGQQTALVPLQNVGGRRGKSLFKGHVIIPTHEFMIAIKGLDKANHEFRRLDPVLTSTLAIKLEVLPLSGTLYINKNVTIPFRVTNVGGGTTKIIVDISDDKDFAQSPKNLSYTLISGGNGTGHFILQAGSTKGETTTMTISAKADGAASNLVQYSVQRITAEEKIIKQEDKVPPTCNVTETVGKCDFGSDPCACSNATWSIKAVIGDVGFGLQSIFSSGAGNKSHFTNDKFGVGQTVSKGVTNALLSADCCHQQAKITVVDLAGNIGLCDVTITAGYTPPDPRLCVKPSKTVTSSTNATHISCNVTDVDGSCDLKSAPCDQQIWNISVSLGNEGYGKYTAVPIGAGANSNFTLNNRTAQLSMDCCHPSVSVRVLDIAGNLGQCDSSINVQGQPVSQTAKAPPSSSALPIGAIAGGAVGGVAVIGGVVGLAVFLSKKFASNAVTPLKTGTQP